MDVFWETLRDQALLAWTPYVVVGYVVTAYLARDLPPAELGWLRLGRMFLVLHVIMQLVVAGTAAAAYDTTPAAVVALAFQLLCVVALGTVLVSRIALPRLGLRPPRILVDILTAVAVLVAMIAVGKRAGLSVAGLITTSAVLTAVIGFSLQDTLGNVMGGLAMQMDNSVRLGDWISLGRGQPQGRVTEIRWRYTAIETREWETIIIPNGILMKSQVIIAGRRQGVTEPRWQRRIDFYVDFRTPPTVVIDTVESALRTDPIRVQATMPPAHAVIMGFKDSVVWYQARYWLSDLSSDDPPDGEIRIKIYFALKRAGIQLAIPAAAVFLTQESSERNARKSDAERAERRRSLDQVELFKPLPPAMLDKLADELVLTPFARNEAVCQEGAMEDGLYMIVSGDALVQIGRGTHTREVARLGPGQVFGEMSLMTGEPRAATVIAGTDLVCFRVDKAAFEGIMHANPEIAEQVADVLAARRMALDAARGDNDASPKKRETTKQDLLGRIRSFFGLRE